MIDFAVQAKLSTTRIEVLIHHLMDVNRKESHATLEWLAWFIKELETDYRQLLVASCAYSLALPDILKVVWIIDKKTNQRPSWRYHSVYRIDKNGYKTNQQVTEEAYSVAKQLRAANPSVLVAVRSDNKPPLPPRFDLQVLRRGSKSDFQHG